MSGHGGFALPGDNWTTPDVCSGARDMSKIDPELQKRADTRRTTGLPTEVAMWLTPNVPNGGRSVSAELVQSKGTTPDGQKRTVGLESQTRFWASPNAHDGRRPGADLLSTQGANLSRDAALWPTPAASEARLGFQDRTNGKKGTQVSLSTVAMLAYSPPARQTRAGPPSSPPNPGLRQQLHDRLTTNQQRQHFAALCDAACLALTGRPGAELPPLLLQTLFDNLTRQRLNPEFAGRLMGWPLMWTHAEPSASSASEMALSHYRRLLQQQLSYYVPGAGAVQALA